MKTIIIVMLLVCTKVAAQNPIQRNLLGKVTSDSLLKEPFSTWYKTGYEQYHPTSSTIAQFKATNFKKLKYQLFFGSWCGDSKREVPRILKLLDSLGVAKDNIELIGTDNGDSTIKKSPTGEEYGKNIFRVPTLIVYKNGQELDRIIEFPVTSLEQDLLAIVKEENYTPNYAFLEIIADWINNGVLLDENVSTVGLTNIVRPMLYSEYFLISTSKLLFAQGKRIEAIKLARINYQIFPEKHAVVKNLGDLLLQNEEKSKAVTYLETALKLASKEEFDTCLKHLYKAKSL